MAKLKPFLLIKLQLKINVMKNVNAKFRKSILLTSTLMIMTLVISAVQGERSNSSGSNFNCQS